MANIEKNNDRIPSLKNLNLTRTIFNDIANDLEFLELSIRIEETNLNVKELSSYLELIYKIDGQLSEINFAKYSHNPRRQIEISEVRFGSWEIVIERLLNSIEADKLGILYLCLKYLPKVIETFVDKFHTYYQILDTREDYIEKRERRRNRRELRNIINDDEELNFLDKKQKEKIIIILDGLYEKAGDTKIAASRFTQKFIKDIQLSPKNKSKNRLL